MTEQQWLQQQRCRALDWFRHKRSTFCWRCCETRSLEGSTLEITKKRLQKRQRMLVNGLEKAEIKCHKGNAGLFYWANMRHLLGGNTFESEMELWRKILLEVRLNVSLGQSCHCSEPGWFRVCFANMFKPTLDLAMQRLKAFVVNYSTTITVTSPHMRPWNTSSIMTVATIPSNQLDAKRKSVAKWVCRLSVQDRVSEPHD